MTLTNWIIAIVASVVFVVCWPFAWAHDVAGKALGVGTI